MTEERPLAIRHELRVELLAALDEENSVALEQFALRSDAALSVVEYHAGLLADTGAVTIADGTATITDQGRELHRLAQVPDRRRVDRRHGERRTD